MLENIQEVEKQLCGLERGEVESRSGVAEIVESVEERSNSEEANHRKEIARLEAEMAMLWGPLYKPPVSGTVALCCSSC